MTDAYLARYSPAEQPASSSWTHRPTLHLIGVRPHEIYCSSALTPYEPYARDSPQNAPSCGISCARARIRIWSRVQMSGESPPCTHRVSPSIICAESDRGVSNAGRHSPPPDLGSQKRYNMLSTLMGCRIFAGIRLEEVRERFLTLMWTVYAHRRSHTPA